MARTPEFQLTYLKKYPHADRHINLLDVVRRFGSEDTCRDYLVRLRWPDGVTCPQCDSKSISTITTRAQFDCNQCRYRFSVTTGTLFDNTKLPLWKWFAAVYLMLESKKSMSANQISRTIGTTYKTSWFLCHRIREAMESMDSGPMLFGIVELDETVLTPYKRFSEHKKPGQQRIGHKWKPGERVYVAGALQRNGQVRLRHVPDVKKTTLHAFVRSVCKDETEAFYTDELRSYMGIADHNTRHETVNHSAEQWVVGDVHTNGIENVWSLFKRSIVGAFHKITVKHLDRYLREQEFRINNRDNQHSFRDVMRRLLSREALRYSGLVSAQDQPHQS